MRIKVDMLEKAVAMAFEQFRILYGSDIEIDVDYYWTVSHPHKVDMSRSPELEVGSLSDHVEIVEKLARGEIDPYPLMLCDIGELMKQCGEATLEVKPLDAR